MDKNDKPLILVFLILFIGHVSGTDIPPPRNVNLYISEGEVILHWENPENAPADAVYNVQMTKHVAIDWANVSSCMGITRTYCLLSADIAKINDYAAAYLVGVQLVEGNQSSKWKKKRFLLNEGELQPPSFSLRATSSTLKVLVHENPILRKIYPYDVTYKLYLEEAGRENKTTKVYLEDDEGNPEGRTKTFTGLQWGKNYCISVEVKANGGFTKSKVSPKQCQLLPEQEFYIIAVTSLSLLVILTVVAVAICILLVYLRRPAKTPVALKSPVSGWEPLSVTEGSLEVVTDKGWFLSGYRPDGKPAASLPETSLTIIEDGEEENRRTSLDSGVSVEANSTADNRGRRQERQEDSGCGSMGSPEISAHSHTDYPMQDESLEADEVSKREDSGMGLGCPHHSSFLKLDSQDTKSLVETVIVGNYRTQSPSEMQVQSRDSENMLKQIPARSPLADVVTGYKPGPLSCICSQTGQCSWCHRHGSYGPEGTKLCRAVCIENVLLGGTSDLVDSSRVGKTHMDSVITNLEESLLHVSDTFPLLTSRYEQHSNMNNVSLSLCDVQLTTD
ncbi:PREDICTED: interferon alpha/beta receptor 1-like [Poecilia mexicana]|uniref:interferon alpha/beta receptor 1-like n=1 Tax=Poecilia mexicana TaxID=48701 RepID=UPI00072E94C5|nr:PREDICTED: interferon alpha/beta receptor 1-like [Poecilia mexicana]